MDFKKRNGGPFVGGVSQAKRGKMATEWEDSPSQFEEELSMFDEGEIDMEEMEGQAGHDVIPVGRSLDKKHILSVKGCGVFLGQEFQQQGCGKCFYLEICLTWTVIVKHVLWAAMRQILIFYLKHCIHYFICSFISVN